ncbi:hypothetical protein [Halocynthiibacter sp.]|uniref:hypothetical protein n=1 Tax=Halocynthiibacter sp. TaxID=1979210 RepID=UPI003C602E42
MSDFSFSTSMSVMRKTAPFLFFRMAVYFGIAVAWILATGTGAGIGWGVGAMGDDGFQASSTLWGGAAGFGIAGAALFFMRDYILYMVKAGHIAVMIEYLEGRDIPGGKGQIAYAQGIVKERFAQANVLFAIDRLIKGVIRAVTGLVQGIASLLPIPGLDGIMNLVRAFLKVAVGLIDEVILAHLIREKVENPWTGAQEALVLYAQNAKPMLKNAAIITIVSYILSFVVFLIMLAPAGAVVYMIPGGWSAGGFVFAIIFAWAVKAALIEPFAIACLLQAYFKVTEGQTPDPEWMNKLENTSGKFRSLGEKAVSWVSGGRAGTSTDAPAQTG